MPESAWGSEYVAVRHSNRWPTIVEKPPWRIIGSADGTQLTYEPARPEGAPETINRGQLAIFATGEPFVVRAQDEDHHFFLSAHMSPGHYVLQQNGRKFDDESKGGSVSIATLPTSRWAKRYPFFLIVTREWTEHSLVVVRKRGGGDVSLDCHGTITDWQPATDGYEVARIPLFDTRGNPVPKDGKICEPGPHWLQSDTPFQASLWGITTTMRPAPDELKASSGYGFTLVGADLPPAPPTSK